MIIEICTKKKLIIERVQRMIIENACIWVCHAKGTQQCLYLQAIEKEIVIHTGTEGGD